MKKSLLILAVLLASSVAANAQWTTTGTVTSTTNTVGVGTTLPKTNVHIVSSGTDLDAGNAYGFASGGGLLIQANTGGRTLTTGAQLEFAIPANSDGTNIWGQARIVTVAGNSNTSNATGKMIIGTRRSFNKLGTGNQWYYGNDLTIDGTGNIGINTITPSSQLSLGIATGNKKLFIYDSGTEASGFGQAYSEFRIFGTTSGTNHISFGKYDLASDAFTEQMRVDNSGNLSIGTTDSKSYKLAVNGSAIATSMTVKLQANWPDYVFKKDYQLPSLTDVKTYIDQNQHLPDMPSEKEVAKDGLNLGEMNKLLVKKVEELTLYLIEKDKKEKEQEAINQELKNKLKKLEENLNKLIQNSDRTTN
ncbi:hypothetical protein [Mucilaginibacter sp. 3215]|uniref:hypothetical protein n=1 Tax=Mucilaginibacter sp. 3215 TaxID=3373912 RepID=UPI003D1F0F28